ncbi:MAG: glutathione S-transferase N-terminal domain-containing protein [Pseudomonadota bacterium]
MADLTAFPITQKWPAQDPSVLQLYAFPTPNGVKASIALEEMGIPYEPHRVTLSDADVKSPAFLSLSPNNKIPAILDPNGPDGTPLALFESGAILIYLAEKSGKFFGASATERAHVLQWLMFQMGGVGPMFGQLGFFWKFAGSAYEDKRPQQRYLNETKRLLGVLDTALEGKDWIVRDYSIADMAIAPWLSALDFYGATEAVGFSDFKNVVTYRDRFSARPAVEKARNIPPRSVD